MTVDLKTRPVTARPARPSAAPGSAARPRHERLKVAVAAGTMSVREVRDVSAGLFARLGELEEGTREYAAVRTTLVEINMQLVKYAAKRFGARGGQGEDILQVGSIGLIKAIDRFDPDYGVEFVTFAMPTIVGEMKRFFRDTNWAVHVPRRLQELRLNLARATDALGARLDRAPTVAELAGHLGIAEEDVLEGMVAANAHTAASIDVTAGGDEDDAGASWSRRIGFDDPGYEGVDNLTALKPLVAGLPERERLLLSLRFSGDMTQAQIGRRLGLSQMHISRLLSTTLARLRRGMLSDG